MCRIDPTLTFRSTSDSTRVQAFGEVFTPLRFVGDMLDMLDPATWTNPTTTLVEPTCGDGVFVVEVLRRRFAGLGRRRSKRAAIALAITTIWAVDIQHGNPDECRANVLRLVLNHLYPAGATIDDVKADIVFISAIIAAIHHHVRVGDGLAFKPTAPAFLALPEGEQKQAAGVQLDILRTLLAGRTAASWLALIFQPAQRSPVIQYQPAIQAPATREEAMA